MGKLTEPIGIEIAAQIEAEGIGWVFEPDTTLMDVISTVLGMSVQAQCDEPNDELWSLANVIGIEENAMRRLFDDVSGYVQRAATQAIESWQENAERIEQGAGRARRIASEWHGGQGSALLSFSTAGATCDGAVAEEIRYELVNADVNVHGEAAIDDLTWLAEYVGMLPDRSMQAGWSELWD